MNDEAGRAGALCDLHSGTSTTDDVKHRKLFLKNVRVNSLVSSVNMHPCYLKFRVNSRHLNAAVSDKLGPSGATFSVCCTVIKWS